jgi:hypothetical protein
MQIKLPNNEEVGVDKGLVVVGANGCGKTRLGVWLEKNTVNKDLVHRISAQKSLLFPSNIRLMLSTDKAQNALLYGNENSSASNKDSHRYGGKPATVLLSDYDKLLIYLFSDESEVNRAYREESKNTENKVVVPSTKLDRIKAIWEEILPHRLLIIENGDVKAKPNIESAEAYSASDMSDGERVIFYLIGQCLSAKQNSMIIIDEPEMHLHKAIQSTLWNKIERERVDCVFVYLTHDVAFAASRTGFTKLWLESHDGKNIWQLKQLEESQKLPEELLLELYGSRRKILLVEGGAGSKESKFYQNIFEVFLIKPCGSCENVISYVKALKNNNEFHHVQVYGLIDRDRRTRDEIAALKKYGIFMLEVAEFENLFATPEILKIVAERQLCDAEKKLEEVKTFVFDQFNEEFNNQVQLHVQEEIRWRLKKLDLSKLKDSSLLELINADIDVDNIKQRLKKEFTTICDNDDYICLLKKYNRKSIASRIGYIFGLKADELPSFVFRLSNQSDFQEKIRDAVLAYLPPEFNKLLADKQSEQIVNQIEGAQRLEKV